MDSGLIYRAYRIYHDGTEFVAEPDIPEYPVFEIGSQSVDRLILMIDELYEHLDISDQTGTFSAPDWFKIWLRCEFPQRARHIGEERRIRRSQPVRGEYQAPPLPADRPRRKGVAGRARKSEAAE